MTFRDISELSARINYSFKDRQLLLEAMTHRSYSAENGLSYDNQRLEFLGDSVIQIIVTEYLYYKYPDETEGPLTKMRSAIAMQSSLAKFAADFELGGYIRMGRGEVQSGGMTRVSTLCDGFEALAGAVRIDGGLEAARELLAPLLEKHYPEPASLLSDLNPKGMLQEYTQKFCGCAAPLYAVEHKQGPEHDCVFSVAVTLNGEVIGRGQGKSRKMAEMCAAETALERLKALSTASGDEGGCNVQKSECQELK